MQNGYTQETLIQYYYQELSREKEERIESDLETDLELKEEYSAISSTLNLLDELMEKPDPSSVELILEYSASQENLKFY